MMKKLKEELALQNVKEQLHQLVVERPVGTEANRKAAAWFLKTVREWGCEGKKVSFSCMEWKKAASTLRCAERTFPIAPAPFSLGAELKAELVRVKSKEGLQQMRREEAVGRILCLEGELAKEPLMPKDFPFYYPEEHRWLNDTLENLQPAAILAVTGKHPLTGENPFPLTDDGAFQVPSAAIRKEDAGALFQLASEQKVELRIHSERLESTGTQPMVLISPGKQQKEAQLVVIGAHLDTKYDTPGALDNATGVVTLLQLMRHLKNGVAGLELLFIPFNGEEHYQVPGQMAALKYLEGHWHRLKLMINLDGLGHQNGRTALSMYNLDSASEDIWKDVMKNHPVMTSGDSWVEGDHSMFAFQGIPCLALTSSELLTEVTPLAHTPADTLDHVAPEQILNTAAFLAEGLHHWSQT